MPAWTVGTIGRGETRAGQVETGRTLDASSVDSQGSRADRDPDYRWAKSESRVDSPWASDTLGRMELNVPPDLETKLARAADRRGMTPELLALEAIERAVDYDDWFLREVEKGLAQVERGEVLAHDEVGARLERRLTQARTRP